MPRTTVGKIRLAAQQRLAKQKKAGKLPKKKARSKSALAAAKKRDPGGRVTNADLKKAGKRIRKLKAKSRKK